MSSNENNSSFENQKKIHSNYYDEIDLISTNPKISNADTSGTEVSPKYNISKQISSSINSSASSSDLIYGISIEIKKPRNIGSMKAFLYINNFPIIVIGPDCK